MAAAGRVNGYVCDSCGGKTVTIHRDEGVTPMFIGCRALPGCQGRAVSLMYTSNPAWELPEPKWEWYRPESTRHLSAEVADHVRRGGLLLREVR